MLTYTINRGDFLCEQRGERDDLAGAVQCKMPPYPRDAEVEVAQSPLITSPRDFFLQRFESLEEKRQLGVRASEEQPSVHLSFRFSQHPASKGDTA
jgi:hypothetical protein